PRSSRGLRRRAVPPRGGRAAYRRRLPPWPKRCMWLALAAAAPVPVLPLLVDPLLFTGLPLLLGFPFVRTFPASLVLPLLMAPLTQ
ncbi:hypothetical protein ACFC0M_32820, partial [Streptomyces sp. NPDC056149]|uniref:hypothetical protein n=1 Tax=Streptomyces sp. NPDC056149 TaxID=3345728 RepID=UPI0035E32470